MLKYSIGGHPRAGAGWRAADASWVPPCAAADGPADGKDDPPRRNLRLPWPRPLRGRIAQLQGKWMGFNDCSKLNWAQSQMQSSFQKFFFGPKIFTDVERRINISEFCCASNVCIYFSKSITNNIQSHFFFELFNSLLPHSASSLRHGSPSLYNLQKFLTYWPQLFQFKF